jgi:hypothetical protein
VADLSAGGSTPARPEGLERVLPWLIVAAVTALAWFVLLPWDWSTVDAQGREIDGGEPWTGIFLVAVVSGLTVSTVVRRWPAAVLGAPLAGLATICVLYTWRASQARTHGANLWLAGLVGVILPLSLLGTFGGAWLAVRSSRRRQQDGPAGGD